MSKLLTIIDDEHDINDIFIKCDDIIDHIDKTTIKRKHKNLYTFKYKNKTVSVKYHWFWGYNLFINEKLRYCDNHKKIKIFKKIKNIYKSL